MVEHSWLVDHLERLTGLHAAGQLTTDEFNHHKAIAIHHHSGIPIPVMLAITCFILVVGYLLAYGDQDGLNLSTDSQHPSVRPLGRHEWRAYEIVASSKASLDALTEADIVLRVDSAGLSVFEEMPRGQVREPFLVFAAHSEIIDCEALLRDADTGEGYILFKLANDGMLDFLSKDAAAIKRAYDTARPASTCVEGERIDVLYGALDSTGRYGCCFPTPKEMERARIETMEYRGSEDFRDGNPVL
jgi:hypothetical protein